MKKLLIALALSLVLPVAGAAPAEQDPSEPEIRIRHGKDKTIYEYSVNGQLMEIKIVPKVGPAYYLVPVEGGFARYEESRLVVPSWVIFRW